MLRRSPWLLFFACAASLGGAHADEGMWTVDDFPRARVKAALGVEIGDAWLEHLRLSSVRFGDHGSGAFVSPTGLVLTNHHVGADCIAKLGSTGGDYHRDGFYAARAADELRCPDLELDVLMGIEDVTAQVRAAADAADPAARAPARRAKLAELEKACADRTKQRCDVVTLYRGGRYALYRYRRYRDVRLVFAPEFAIAFFGGDPDNFSYPRYDLDVAVFRAYDGAKAARPAHWLRFSEGGIREGDATFAAGHPGTTERLATARMLESYRDVVYPTTLDGLRELRAVVSDYGGRGAAQERAARKLFFTVENGLKAYGGYLAGLTDPALLPRRREAEARQRSAAVARPALATELAAADEAIARAEQARREIHPRWALLEGDPRRAFTERNPFRSRLFGIARALVRLVDEAGKPSEQRLREYADAGRPSLELELYSPAPIDLALEEQLLASALTHLKVALGDDPVVRVALAGQAPATRARALVRGTILADVLARRRMAASRGAQDAAQDPLLGFARAVDAAARSLRTRMDDDVTGAEEDALGRLARAQLELDGDATAPDATATLRISYGRVAGYRDGARSIPPITVLAGLYARAQKAENRAPWALPARWLERKATLRPTTPINFVTTNDIIGGSSGSPVVDAKGELVGVIFDENQFALPNIFGYRDGAGRAVCVHAAGVLDALRKVYDAGALADELTGRAAAGMP